MRKNRIVVYSAVFGGKDSPPRKRPIDFVLFDNLEKIPTAFLRDPARASRFFKLLPHRFFPDYDFSIWVDGNMELVIDPDEMVGKFLLETGHFHAQQRYDVAKYAPKGFVHTNLYHEAAHCIRLKKDNPVAIANQVKQYRSEGFPDGSSLWMGGVIIRRHNHPSSIKLGEAWYAEILKHSCRDQISLPYVLWKTGLEIFSINPAIEIAKRFPHLH